MWFKEKPIVVKRKKPNRRKRSKRDALLMVTARSKKQKAEGLQKLGILAMTLVAVLGILWAIVAGVHWASRALITDSDQFAILDLELSSDGQLRPRHIREYANIEEGLNLFEVSLEEIRQNLESVPIVRTVNLRRELPNKLIVTITERNAIARLGRDNRRDHLAVDREGHVLGPSSRAPGLPSITGLRDRGLRPGRRIDQPLVADALQVLDICDTTEVGHVVKIKNVDVRHPDYLDLELSQSERIKLGRVGLEWRLRKLGRVLQEAAELGRVVSKADLTVDKNFPVEYRADANQAAQVAERR